MAVRFRPWDSRRRFVCRLPAPAAQMPFRRRWIAFHAEAPDWTALLARALGLMLIETSPDASGLMIAAAGRVTWRAGRRWTTLSLDLSGFSPRKRSLIAGAIAKAARYTR